jgi:hypothetical protein
VCGALAPVPKKWRAAGYSEPGCVGRAVLYGLLILGLSVRFIAQHVTVLSAPTNADVAELHSRTWMMRLQPDVPLQGPALIRHETTH